jgi:hypothetical protein
LDDVISSSLEFLLHGRHGISDRKSGYNDNTRAEFGRSQNGTVSERNLAISLDTIAPLDFSFSDDTAAKRSCDID